MNVSGRYHNHAMTNYTAAQDNSTFNVEQLRFVHHIHGPGVLQAMRHA